jgi:hypothetical protein
MIFRRRAGHAVTASDGTRFSVNADRLYIMYFDGRDETRRAADEGIPTRPVGLK